MFNITHTNFTTLQRTNSTTATPDQDMSYQRLTDFEECLIAKDPIKTDSN
jgi:hypothetical protein